MTTTGPAPITPAALHLLTELAIPEDGHGRWHRGIEAACASLRRALQADDPATAIAAWLARRPDWDNPSCRRGYRAIQTTAAEILTLPEPTPMSTRALHPLRRTRETGSASG